MNGDVVTTCETSGGLQASVESTRDLYFVVEPCYFPGLRPLEPPFAPFVQTITFPFALAFPP